MPELPEVELIKRELGKELDGKKVKLVELAALKPIPRYKTKKAFTALLEGRKLGAVDRKGTWLTVALDSGDVLAVSLGSSGSLVRTKSAKEPVDKGTQVTITFTQGGQLRLVDLKGTAELLVCQADALASEVPEVGQMGFDPLESAMSWVQFGDLLRRSKQPLKTLLMDQKLIAGLGPMWSDEILWAAGLRHDRTADSLTSQEVRRLYRGLTETLQEATKQRGGSSLSSENDPFAEPADTGVIRVYDREGLPCRRCRSKIVKQKVGSKHVFLCEQCQV